SSCFSVDVNRRLVSRFQRQHFGSKLRKHDLDPISGMVQTHYVIGWHAAAILAVFQHQLREGGANGSNHMVQAQI
ncbi:MAG: hypothetical protein M3R24_33195, partial [Chloroflexota bacterium]|nr:hypothetical protein [Chloroflexota bacterium]